MRSSISILLFFLISLLNVQAQFLTTQFKYRVYVKPSHIVLQAKLTDGNLVNLPKGSVVTSVKKYKIGDEEFTATIAETLAVAKTVKTTKENAVKRALPGLATISVDKEDKSKLHINYWLSPLDTLSPGTKILIDSNKVKFERILMKRETYRVTEISLQDHKSHVEYQYKLDRASAELETFKNNLTTYPTKQELDQLQKKIKLVQDLKNNGKRLDWVDQSNLKIYQIGKPGQPLKVTPDTTRIFAQKYSNDPYYIKLENRQFVSFNYKTWETGALTIPFKYRPKFKKNGVDVPDDFIAELNIGAYFGYAMGKIKYRYRKNEDSEPTKMQFSVGPFFSVSRAEIDSVTTQSASEPLKQKRAIATFSPGIGLMYSIHDFRVGAFIGTDIGAGQVAKKWDYNKKVWFGFGIGYNIGLFWQPKK